MNVSSIELTKQQTGMELAASAAAALAKATIEAKFVIALRPENRRVHQDVRASVLDACRRPAFAESAWYRKKQGQKQDPKTQRWVDNIIEGFSIRFAEMAIQAWRMVDCSATTVWEDTLQRQVRITVTDLQTNISYTDDALLSKTVERRKLRDGQVALSRRETSEGNYVFIVQCTDEELNNKVNAAKSRAIRNSGLRLIPSDILEEAREAIKSTRITTASSTSSTQKIVAGFAGIGVSQQDLEAYLGHSIASVAPQEIVDLRSVYTAIQDGDATWQDYVEKADTVPMGDAHTDQPQPPTPPPQPTPAAPAPEPTESTQQQLANLILTAGLTFSDLVAWGQTSGNIKDATSLSGFDDIPLETAKRLMRASKGLVAQMKAAKNPNAA